MSAVTEVITDSSAPGRITRVTGRPASVSPISPGATFAAKASVKSLPLRRAEMSARSALLAARSASTCLTSVSSTSPCSGPPPSATPMASARKTDTIETMW